MQKIKDFWIESYKSDPTAFAFEAVSFIFTVLASLVLALTADKPDMLIVYPGYFIGSMTQCYASYRRNAAWIMTLTFYFCIVNMLGYSVAKGWIQ